MRDSDKFLEAIDDMVEILMGKRPNRALEKEMRMIERAKGFSEEHTQEWLDYVKGPKRARTKDGRYRGDDPTTKEFNEAWVSGHTPVKNPFPTPEPSMKWTKKQIIGYCNEFGVLHNSRASKKELLKNIKDTYPNGL